MFSKTRFGETSRGKCRVVRAVLHQTPNLLQEENKWGEVEWDFSALTMDILSIIIIICSCRRKRKLNDRGS